MSIEDRIAARVLGIAIPSSRMAALREGPDEDATGRDIPKDHVFDAKALKPLSKSLWASTVALGHALSAYRHLSRLKSTTVSPDGRLGGKGYVMGLGEIRKRLYEACESLSAISDTIYDEISAPHWKPQLKQLGKNDREDVARFIEEAQGVMEDPEGDAEEAMEDIEGENDEGSPQTKTASADVFLGIYGDNPEDVQGPLGSLHLARYSSSLPVGDLPGGPRIDHIGPGEGEGPYGEYNEDSNPRKPWGRGIDTMASSNVPDASSDGTPTDARDFGLGYGARGEGSTGRANPSGEGDGSKGVHGPQSGLPGSPAQSSGDSTADEMNARLAALTALYGLSSLPEDVAGPVSRSDYYVGSSSLPDAPQNSGDGSQSLMNTYYTQEDTDTGYVRYDYTTHTLRDPSKDNPGRDHEEPWAPGGESTR